MTKFVRQLIGSTKEFWKGYVTYPYLEEEESRVILLSNEYFFSGEDEDYGQ